MTGDDCWNLTCAITGDTEKATDQLFTSGVVAMINVLREERDHLVNQLAAAREHADVMSHKRQYSHVTDSWLRNDLGKLRRLLAEA